MRQRSAQRARRVGTPLERDQAVRPHPAMIRQRETRGLEVDEVDRTRERFDLATELRPNVRRGGTRVFDLAALPRGVAPRVVVRLDETVDRRFEQ